MNRLLLWLGLPHHYLSTGCLHGDHDYCAARSGAVGLKRPASCKFCGVACRCRCHRIPRPVLRRLRKPSRGPREESRGSGEDPA